MTGIEIDRTLVKICKAHFSLLNKFSNKLQQQPPIVYKLLQYILTSKCPLNYFKEKIFPKLPTTLTQKI